MSDLRSSQRIGRCNFAVYSDLTVDVVSVLIALNRDSVLVQLLLQTPMEESRL